MLHVTWSARRLRVMISRPIRPFGRVCRERTIISGSLRSLAKNLLRLVSVEAVEECCWKS